MEPDVGPDGSAAPPDAVAQVGGPPTREYRAMVTFVVAAVFIFVVAPSEQELERRQVERGSESPQDLASRRRIGEREMTYAKAYEHVVTNDDVERAVGEIRQIIEDARRRVT